MDAAAAGRVVSDSRSRLAQGGVPAKEGGTMPDVPPPEPPILAPRHDPEEEPRVERANTDESLRVERDSADAAVDGMKAVEAEADRVLELARSRADAVLTEAREKVDGDRRQGDRRDGLAEDRALADEVLEDERAAEDEDLRLERERNSAMFLALLPLERASTNLNLLTERARADAALSYRDDFLGIVSHDLNNLLAGILLSAGALSRSAPATEEGQRTIAGAKRIQLYTARMRRLVGDLVDVTSLTAGKLAVKSAPCDSRALVTEALETFRLLAVEKQITIQSDVFDQPVRVAFDHDRMLQVLANLVSNAIKFTPEGGKVSIRALQLGDELLFSVKDTGPGIPENLLAAVFERFWQAGENDRRGLGLGLYIAKSIVEAHGGRIWAESRPGEGSTFHFTLPCLTQAESRGVQPAGLPA
jgi:signal transduction histidine kinase